MLFGDKVDGDERLGLLGCRRITGSMSASLKFWEVTFSRLRCACILALRCTTPYCTDFSARFLLVSGQKSADTPEVCTVLR